MHIELPDPHPGRCLNVRIISHSDGSVETLRCLDYEGTRHICEFPEPTYKPATNDNSTLTYTPQAPQRWVKP